MSGKVVIISGPSGAGKSTLVKRLFEICPLPLALSVSATTRAPRPDEVDGISYHFLSHDEFERRRLNDDFLEYKEVFGQGQWVILEIDVAGALSVIDRIPDAITIFINPGSMEELERRLRNRQTDSEEAILRRLQVAKHEMSNRHHYQHQITNDEVDRAARQVSQLLQALETK